MDGRVQEVLEDVEELVAAALAAGYTPGVLTGTVRAAFAGFARRHEPLGVKVLILSGGKFDVVREQIAAALEREGANVCVEPLAGRAFVPGQLTRLLESVEVVVVLTSGGPLPEPWLLGEIEAAIWRFLLLPHSVELVPVSIDGVAVPPLLRAKRYIDLDSANPHRGIMEILQILRTYRSRRAN
jgi:hypothetical protein